MKKTILIYSILIVAISIVKCNDSSKDEMGELSSLNFDLLFAEKKVISGPRCIPLKSKNIQANPYHPSLLSRKGAEIRRGLGIPTILDQNPLSCPSNSPNDCTFDVDKSFSTTISNSFSISLSSAKSFSKSLGTSSTSGKTNSMSKSIGKSMEQSLTKSLTQTDEESLSDQITDSLSKSNEKSAGITKSESREVSETDSISQELTDTKSKSRDSSKSITEGEESSESISEGGSRSNTNSRSQESSSSHTTGGSGGLSFGGSLFGGNIGGSYSYNSGSSSSSSSSSTDERNWSKSNSKSRSKSKTETESEGSSESFAVSNGKSNSKTNSHSSSSSEDNHVSDSISYSLAYAKTVNKGKSTQKGTSDTTGSSYSINDQFTSDESTSITNNINDEISDSMTKSADESNQTSFTVSVSSKQGYFVEPGGCKILVCYPFVVSAVVPYDCIDDSGELKRVNTEMMFIDNSTLLEGKLTCTQSLINCEEKNNGNIFLINDMELVHALRNTKSNANIEYGMKFESELNQDLILMVSENLHYRLVLLSDGNLVIKRYQEIMWQTEMNFFTNFTTRIRINEKGHLIQETKDLYTNTYPDYRSQEWITVWSSAPINHNVTIGVPFDNGKSYILLLSKSGILNLYDAVGALIWCTDIDCKHRFGYKFPEVYLLPILSNESYFSTPYEDNRHNSITPNILKLDNVVEKMFSLNTVCTGLPSNKAIVVSPNQRYKMYLEESGNLVIKDGTRTMWESVSAYMPYAVGPYELVLAPTGHLVIRSSNDYMIWSTLLKNRTIDSNYKMQLLDDGRLTVEDEDSIEVWESSPLREMSTGVTYYKPIEYKFVPCHGKSFSNRKNLTTDSHGNNTLFNNTNVISKNGLWDLAILKEKKLVIRKLNIVKFEVFSDGSKFDKLVLNDAGYLRLLNSRDKLVWSLKFLHSTIKAAEIKPFTLELNNYGILYIKDKFNATVWSLNEELMKYELISNRLNTLKFGEYIVSNNSKGNEWQLKFNRNKIQLFKKKLLISNFFNETECKNNLRPVKLTLSNGKISLADSKNLIICEVNFQNDNDGPFKLILNNAIVEVFNSKNNKIWERNLMPETIN